MPTLTEVLASRRARILKRWTERLRREHARPGLSRGGLRDDLPNILDELVTALSEAEAQSAVPLPPQESLTSASRERQRLRDGLEIGAVVREYGILVDIVLDELAATGATLDTEEWQLAMRCIFEMVASYAKRRDEELRRQTGRHVAFIAHELRNSLGTVGAAIAAQHLVPADERLHGVLDRNLHRLRELGRGPHRGPHAEPRRLAA